MSDDVIEHSSVHGIWFRSYGSCDRWRLRGLLDCSTVRTSQHVVCHIHPAGNARADGYGIVYVYFALSESFEEFLDLAFQVLFRVADRSN
jgi:hypothetical protein